MNVDPFLSLGDGGFWGSDWDFKVGIYAASRCSSAHHGIGLWVVAQAVASIRGTTTLP